MKLVYPEISHVFDTSVCRINTLVIESSALMLALLNDIAGQLQGADGKCVLSEDGKEVPISKNMELLANFVPFEINTKALLSKLAGALEKRAVTEYYLESAELLGNIEQFFFKVSQDFNCYLDFSKISMSSLVKALGVEFCDSYDSLGEKICDYFELVQEFDRKKLFVTFNLRTFMDDEEFEKFAETVIMHQYNLVMIENKEYTRSSRELRYIVDADLCEIQ